MPFFFIAAFWLLCLLLGTGLCCVAKLRALGLYTLLGSTGFAVCSLSILNDRPAGCGEVALVVSEFRIAGVERVSRGDTCGWRAGRGRRTRACLQAESLERASIDARLRRTE